MTTKDIAEAVGKDERTVQRWVSKASDKMSLVSDKMSSSTSMHPADYDLDETCAIIEAGMGANAAAVYRANAQSSAPSAGGNGDLDAAFKAAVVQLTNMVTSLDSRVQTLEGEQAHRKVLAPPPGKSPRAELNEAVRKLASYSYENDYRLAWRAILKEVYYRLHINVTVRARNEGVKPIDFLEREGLLETATSIAVEKMGQE
jgi:hypothetical protein